MITDPKRSVTIDGDRPSQDGIAIYSDEGDDTDRSKGTVYLQFSDGTNSDQPFQGASNKVLGFTVGNPVRYVGKTGDQIRVTVDLNKDKLPGPGPRENAIKAPELGSHTGG